MTHLQGSLHIAQSTHKAASTHTPYQDIQFNTFSTLCDYISNGFYLHIGLVISKDFCDQRVASYEQNTPIGLLVLNLHIHNDGVTSHCSKRDSGSSSKRLGGKDQSKRDPKIKAINYYRSRSRIGRTAQ